MKTKLSMMLPLLVTAVLIAMSVPAKAAYLETWPQSGITWFSVSEGNTEYTGQGNNWYMYINGTPQNTSSFTGSIGLNNGPVDVNVTTIANVDSGSGWANIKPVVGTTLESLTFTPTPANQNAYGDFSFRGQVGDNRQVLIDVKTAQGNEYKSSLALPSSLFTVDKSAPQDFTRIGFYLTNESIQSVIITNPDFKEVKQIEFSPASPVPIPGVAWLLGSGICALIGLKRRSCKN
ncbi:MAG TPA: hypothetical protein VIK40_11495 [Geomonas sp.]